MLGRKIFSAFLSSICIVLILVTIASVSHGVVTFEYAFLYAIFAFPAVFVYGIPTSFISEQLSAKYTRFAHLLSLGLHIVFGLLLFVPFNLISFHEPMGMGIHFLWCFGLFGGVFFYVDRIVKYYWDKGDLKNKGVADEEPTTDYQQL